MDNYKPAKKYYLGIDNIHVMRDSMNKVIEALRNGDVSASPPNQELLVKSQWLKHIVTLLKGAVLTAQQVHYKFSHVVVHCSDGWDRTPQLTGLAQIMLDPYFRTIDGFIVLVEKEWVSFGHRFAERSHVPSNCKVKDFSLSQQQEVIGGSGVSGASDITSDFINGLNNFTSATNNNSLNPGSVTPSTASGRSNFLNNVTNFLPDGSGNKATKYSGPIFYQFLDCVYQIMRQFPEKFEYNERFLRRLLYHLYSCQYGTFLFNSEYERVKAQAEKKTRSVWDYFLARRKQFTNPNYIKSENDNWENSNNTERNVLFPDPRDVKWWAEALGRTDQEMNVGNGLDLSRQGTPIESESSSLSPQDFLNAFQSMNFNNKYQRQQQEQPRSPLTDGLRTGSGYSSTPDLNNLKGSGRSSPVNSERERDREVSVPPLGPTATSSAFPSEGFGKFAKQQRGIPASEGKGKKMDSPIISPSPAVPQSQSPSTPTPPSYTEPLGNTLVTYPNAVGEDEYKHTKYVKKFDNMSIDLSSSDINSNYSARRLAGGATALAGGASALAEDLFGRLTRTEPTKADS